MSGDNHRVVWEILYVLPTKAKPFPFGGLVVLVDYILMFVIALANLISSAN
jgi:hypothetical protein